jgi:hypothetical protein
MINTTNNRRLLSSNSIEESKNDQSESLQSDSVSPVLDRQISNDLELRRVSQSWCLPKQALQNPKIMSKRSQTERHLQTKMTLDKNLSMML